MSSGISSLLKRSISKTKSDITPKNPPIITNLLPSMSKQDTSRSNEQYKPSPLDMASEHVRVSLQSSPPEKPRSQESIQRFRGFSTSISSLFLDEQVVCGAVSWFGLFASSRTEHLLNVRNASRRLASAEGQRDPSKILSMALIYSVILITLTYTIWGFGGDHDGSNYTDNGYRKLEERNNWTLFPSYGLMKVHDNSSLWVPLKRMIKHGLSKKQTEATDARTLEDYNENEYDENDYEYEYYENKSDGDSGQSIHWQDNQDLASNIRTLICLAFLLLVGLVGRRRRMRTRYALIRARIIDDRIHHGGSRLTPAVGSRSENQYDGACSHTLCGCYPIDKANKQEEDMEDDTRNTTTKEDCVNTCFAFLSAACCGIFFKCWAQCGSVCALAQEAREVRLLLAPKLQRLDFITHQPFAEYYGDVYFLRQSWKGMLGSDAKKTGWGPHIRALSTLSRYLLLLFIAVTAVIILTERLNPRANFQWGDAFVLLMTFLQSFVVLGVVHGMFNKSELSLDAVIKFFAAGFLIAFPTAFVFEFIIIHCGLIITYSLETILGAIFGDSYDGWIDANYRWLLTVAEVIQSFLCAALIEELCKYYTFRTVEHPDLIFLTGLDRCEQEKDAFNGGFEVYPFSRDNASRLNQSFDFTNVTRQSRHNNHRGKSPGMQEIVRSETSSSSICEEGSDVRTARQCAAAVTTAMISGAVGLACAENFVYVFFLGGNDTGEELVMLLFRSIFPLHALCAAMQSIGVIKNFLEKEDHGPTNVGVGDIVIPSIILHGTFDTVLMILNSYIDFSWEDYYDQNGDYYGGSQYNGFLLNIIGATCVVVVTLMGIYWYIRENTLQKKRQKGSQMSRQSDWQKNRLESTQISSSKEGYARTKPLKYISPNPVTLASEQVLV